MEPLEERKDESDGDRGDTKRMKRWREDWLKERGKIRVNGDNGYETGGSDSQGVYTRIRFLSEESWVRINLRVECLHYVQPDFV